MNFEISASTEPLEGGGPLLGQRIERWEDSICFK